MFTIAGMSKGKVVSDGRGDLNPQPGDSPTLLQERSVQIVKRANRGHFMFSSELTALNGTTQLQTEGYVCGLNESGVNSQQRCDAMPAESQYSAGKC